MGTEPEPPTLARLSGQAGAPRNLLVWCHLSPKCWATGVHSSAWLS